MNWGKPKRHVLPKVCHCGSGKSPGIMRAGENCWCCGDCYNDKHYCPGPPLNEPVARR